MGVISTFLDVITSFNGFSYVENAKEWGDNIWDNMDGVSNGVLSLTKIDERLYKQLRLEFRDDTVGVFTDTNDCGWAASRRDLTKQERRQLNDEGSITIKRYKL